jgi:hypothetical protein
MDPEKSVEALLGPPPILEAEAITIPVQVESKAEPDTPPAPENAPRKSFALYRPQILVTPQHFFERHMKRSKRKKLLVIAGCTLIVAALSLALFRFGSGRAATKAAEHTADSFIKAEFSADTSRAEKLSDPKSIKTDNIRALAMLIKPALKGQPTRTGQDIQKQDGKHRAVFTYQFSIANPEKNGEEVPVYIVVLLQKDKDKWLVKSQSMSAVAPKADVASYPYTRFN